MIWDDFLRGLAAIRVHSNEEANNLYRHALESGIEVAGEVPWYADDDYGDYPYVYLHRSPDGKMIFDGSLRRPMRYAVQYEADIGEMEMESEPMEIALNTGLDVIL